MTTKTVLRTHYNAHGQVEEWAAPVTLYARKQRQPSRFLAVVYGVITLATTAALLGGLVWLVMAIS